MTMITDSYCRIISTQLADSSEFLHREWLTTNGIGGYASGTLAGALTRSYHGFLVAAMPPPTARIVLVSKVEETVTIGGTRYELSSNVYDNAIHPQGFKLIEEFRAWPNPTWRYRLTDEIIVEKTIVMTDGKNSTWVRYTLIGGSSVKLFICPWLCCKSYHAVQEELAVEQAEVTVENSWVDIRFHKTAPELRLACEGAVWESAYWWYRNIELTEEAERGLSASENALCVGWYRVDLTQSSPVWFCATTETEVEQPPEIGSNHSNATLDPFCTALESAARVFVVHPKSTTGGILQGRHTIIAGYPWFTDWGRDTLISLPGMASVMDPEHVTEVLETFAATMDDGTVANRFPDDGVPNEYNTADASLWFVLAVCQFIADGTIPTNRQQSLVESCDRVMMSIQHGTRYGVWMDREDGLIVASMPGQQLTWMDARIGDHVVTPRGGKPVEINALGYAAMRRLSTIRTTQGKDADDLNRWAYQLQKSFRRRFVRPDGLGLFDVLTQTGPDASIRPNQIFAISLDDTLLERVDAIRVLNIVQRELVTPTGLRTLNVDNPMYCRLYRGDVWRRDTAYHQGTVWPWLFGPFAEAHFKIHSKAHIARSFLEPLGAMMTQYGVGYLPEVCDGDPPHRPGGCIAQAWSVSETLRVWRMLTAAMEEPV